MPQRLERKPSPGPPSLPEFPPSVPGSWPSALRIRLRLYGVRHRGTVKTAASDYSPEPTDTLGLDLPLDHFRLLGVSPATDAQTVLRTLQLRLDRVPDQGYTAETLRARADLLRASADLLSDGERRGRYEADLTALADAPEPLMPALEIPSSREVAGLLLLLEAGQPHDAFALARRCLQPPQAPALGSGREADLALLAGESTLAAAAEYRRERHYEVAARTLQEGLQLLQRMGQLPELRERIQSELESLVPFRVLDLLSREAAAAEERQEGLAMLDQLVQRRGGLEGTADDGFAPEDFQTFFKQIRSFLTVQEQIDLFERWSSQGSTAAAFLSSIALTASGFAQRKPERIAQARQRLEASGRDGIDPLLANLDLLLGDVDGASQRFEHGADPELRRWAETQSDDPLGRLCAWCRDWLSRDVLPGYRDLEADADLEAYFSDRDVVSWVEREDRRQGRTYPAASPYTAAGTVAGLAPGTAPGFAAAGASLDTGWANGPGSGYGSAQRDGAFPFEPAGTWARDTLGGSGRGDRPATRRERRARDNEGGDLEVPLGLGLTSAWRRLRSTVRQRRLWLPAGALALVIGLGSWWLRPSGPERAQPTGATTASAPRPLPSSPTAKAPATGTATPAPPGAPARPAAGPASSSGPGPAPATTPAASPATPAASGGSLAPLTTAVPETAELQALLEGWLQAKTDVMAGQDTPAGLERIAREAPLARLAAERRHDRGLGQTQTLQVQVQEVTILERSPRRIAVQARLAYSDSTRRQGREVARTPATTLRNVYVFGRDGDTWRLAATRPAP